MGFPAVTDLPCPATFTRCIISAMRTYGGADYIQTDAPISPGNGCLVNIGSKMIDIPTAGNTPPCDDFENLDLAIPIDQVSAYVSQKVK